MFPDLFYKHTHTHTHTHTIQSFISLMETAQHDLGSNPALTLRGYKILGIFLSLSIQSVKSLKTNNVFKAPKCSDWLMVCFKKCQLPKKPCHSDDIMILFVSKMHKAKILPRGNIFRDPSQTKLLFLAAIILLTMIFILFFLIFYTQLMQSILPLFVGVGNYMWPMEFLLHSCIL